MPQKETPMRFVLLFLSLLVLPAFASLR